jgi:hypothetical protein
VEVKPSLSHSRASDMQAKKKKKKKAPREIRTSVPALFDRIDTNSTKNHRTLPHLLNP